MKLYQHIYKGIFTNTYDIKYIRQCNCIPNEYLNQDICGKSRYGRDLVIGAKHQGALLTLVEENQSLPLLKNLLLMMYSGTLGKI